MIVTYNLKKGQKPTEEQLREVREAAKHEIVFDEDSPEYSLEQLREYRDAAIKKRGEKPIEHACMFP